MKKHKTRRRESLAHEGNVGDRQLKDRKFILSRIWVRPFILFFSIILIPFPLLQAQEHGDLIRAKGATNIYLIHSGQKRLIINEQVFTQMGFKASDVKELDPQTVMSIPEGPPLVSREFIAPFPDGTLIRVKETNQTYLIQGGKKCYIPDLETLQAQGFQWDQAIEVDKKTSDAIFTGIPIASVKPPYQYTPPTPETEPVVVSPLSPSYFTSSLQNFGSSPSSLGPPSEDPYDTTSYPTDPGLSSDTSYDPTYYQTDPGLPPESLSALSRHRPHQSIVRIDPNRLTLRDEKGKQTTIGTRYANQFRLGERVVLKDNMLVKLGSVIQPECIIIKFEGLRVTVSRENDITKNLAVGAFNTHGLNIGDTVWVQNCQLSVMKAMPIKRIIPTGIITWISQSKVVVAQENDRSKNIMITVKNPSGLKVADRVSIEGCELIKVK